MGTEEPKTFKLVVMLILDLHHPLEWLDFCFGKMDVLEKGLEPTRVDLKWSFHRDI